MNDNRKQQFLAADVMVLEREIADLMAAYPELVEDGSLRADMIEGSTNMFEVLDKLVGIERDANSAVAAADSRISDLQARKQRHEKRKAAMRQLMFRLMKAANLPKAPLVEATLSIGKGRVSVEIVDEALVPKKFLKVVKSPDKTAIRAALDAGKAVPGARMSVGTEYLAVRAA